jgi:NADP-dependent 3-hydroxy acid dehydrogenase YdfG
LLENKVALLTGATGALGRVVTKGLVEHGVKVVASYRTEEKLAELFNFVGELKDDLTVIQTDVTDEQSVRNFVQKAIEKQGRVDIFLNIVGAYMGGTDVANAEVTQWDFMMNLNLKSAFLCSKMVLPYMIKQNYGKIVSVSSWIAVEKTRRVKSRAQISSLRYI